jgi:hypothetical protein
MKKQILFSFAFIFTICMVFAAATDHRWEDWYITFRASKNLALGNGLVFNEGERLMTYTSPLGTLMPALIKFIFLNNSDEVTIWGYRILCGVVLASSSFFLERIFTKLNVKIGFYFFAIFLFTFNFLVIDNTINGMESAFMVFFEFFLLSVIITQPRQYIGQLALAFAGIMYSRPDGFIYAGTLILSLYLFAKLPILKFTKENIKSFAKALGLSILIFIPWIAWTWMYYGTPIPHTIIAKARHYDLQFFVSATANFISNFKGSPNLYLPSYAVNFGSWPIFTPIATLISIISMFYWINPKANLIARALSFASMLMVYYLNVVSGLGPAPWYLPSAITPSLIVLTLALSDIWCSKIRLAFYPILIGLTIFTGVTFYQGTRMIRNQQRIVEFGNREQIGKWIKANKQPKDTGFMECLGYIGFYSELKTFDYPGMSSPEMVYARKTIKSENYADLINYLRPNWLILRAGESSEITARNPELMQKHYKLVKKFDQREAVNRANFTYGKNYLYVDAHFNIYHRTY